MKKQTRKHYTADVKAKVVKGYTGQYNDALTGLDYYNARYYDPVAGVFLSADTAQGNTKGMNPYGYVGGNPETMNDPTGKYIGVPPGSGLTPPPPCNQWDNYCGRGSGTPWNGGGSGSSGSGSTGGGSGSGGANTPPNPKIVTLGGCDAACVAHDQQLIRTHRSLVSQLATDITSAGISLLTLILDWGLNQVLAIILDVTSLVIQIFAIVKDIADLNGNTPAWMITTLHFLQYIVGALNVAKGFLVLFGGVSALLSSFSVADGVFTMAKTAFKDYLGRGVAGILAGGAQFYSGYTGIQTDNINSLTPQELHNECLSENLAGCE